MRSVVVDASALVHALLAAGPAGDEAREVLGRCDDLHAPALLDLEVLSALRRFRRADRIAENDADAMVVRLRNVPITRHDHVALLDVTWQLRDRCSAYDASYLALSIALDATLLTSDRRLGAAAIGICPVQVLTPAD